MGDLQVNLVDKHHRSDKSHQIAQQVRPALEQIAKRHGAKGEKWWKCRPARR